MLLRHGRLFISAIVWYVLSFPRSRPMKFRTAKLDLLGGASFNQAEV